MARHVFTILCRSVTTDVFSNSLSLVDIAEQLGAQQNVLPQFEVDQPAVLGPFDWVLVTALQRSDVAIPEEFKSRVVIALPTGEALPGPESVVDLKSGLAARNLTKIPVLPYRSDGIYRFQFQVLVESTWTVLGEYVVPFNMQGLPQVESHKKPDLTAPEDD